MKVDTSLHHAIISATPVTFAVFDLHLCSLNHSQMFVYPLHLAPFYRYYITFCDEISHTEIITLSLQCKYCLFTYLDLFSARLNIDKCKCILDLLSIDMNFFVFGTNKSCSICNTSMLVNTASVSSPR